MCAPPMVRFLREVTGHADLCVDPVFHGGGMHESFRGGWLNIHADWTQHPVLPLTRRLKPGKWPKSNLMPSAAGWGARSLG